MDWSFRSHVTSQSVILHILPTRADYTRSIRMSRLVQGKISLDQIAAENFSLDDNLTCLIGMSRLVQGKISLDQILNECLSETMIYRRHLSETQRSLPIYNAPITFFYIFGLSALLLLPFIYYRPFSSSF